MFPGSFCLVLLLLFCLQPQAGWHPTGRVNFVGKKKSEGASQKKKNDKANDRSREHVARPSELEIAIKLNY